MTHVTRFAAPAKLNLFLHVIGRRSDGYHLLQTAFRLIDLCDWVTIAPRDDSAIRLECDFSGVPADQNLALRAALALQKATGARAGARSASRSTSRWAPASAVAARMPPPR
jgi:4-diphosphocytidyl-2-C-methyl-D-erythritol kinase